MVVLCLCVRVFACALVSYVEVCIFCMCSTCVKSFVCVAGFDGNNKIARLGCGLACLIFLGLFPMFLIPNSEFFPPRAAGKKEEKLYEVNCRNLEFWNNWKNWKFWKFGKLKNSKHVMAGFRRFASSAQGCKERDNTLTLMRNPGTIAQMDGHAPNSHTRL